MEHKFTLDDSLEVSRLLLSESKTIEIDKELFKRLTDYTMYLAIDKSNKLNLVLIAALKYLSKKGLIKNNKAFENKKFITKLYNKIIKEIKL